MATSSRKSVRNGTIGLQDRPMAEFVQKDDVDVPVDAPFQFLITSALLASTAFRMKDQDGLTEAMRMLALAVRPFEATSAGDDDS